MTTDSADYENSHNDDILPASLPRTTSERTAKPGQQQPSTTQAGFRAIPGEASPRRTGLSNCSVCDTKFTIFEHRHMCQKCQEPVCNRCSRSRKVFRAGTKPKRVCDECDKTFPSATSPRLTGLSNCSVCDTKFTIFEHRHICQKCQEPVCNRCSRSRKVFRAGTKPERVCDHCVKTFPSGTKIVSDIGNTIESGKCSRLTLPASDAANICAERTIVFPSPVTTLFGIGMVGMPSSRTVPPPTPAGGSDNVENKKPGVQIAATTEVKTPPSSSSLFPVQQQDRAQGDMELVTNGDQGQAESDDKGPDFNSAMSGAAFVPAVAAAEIQEDTEASHAQVTNEAADTFDRAVLGLDVSHFLAASSPSIATPASPSTTAILSQDQEVVRNEVGTVQTDAVDGALLPAELEVALPAPEKDGAHLKWMHIAIKICGCLGTVHTNVVDGALLPAELEIALPAPEENHNENDAETAASNSASKKWMNVATKIGSWGLAAVFMGLEVGLLLFERD